MRLRHSNAVWRLRSIIGEIEAIADNDEGRRSELVQAEARMFAVEQQQNTSERELQDALSQLQRYSGKAVKSTVWQIRLKG